MTLGAADDGILILNPELSIGADELVLIALASMEDEHRDEIQYLPIT